MIKNKFIVILFLLVCVAVVLWQSGIIPQASVSPNELRVYFADIGQGDGIVLVTPHSHAILIDGGPDATILTRLGQILPFSTHTFDLAIVSHNHSDHITGLDDVLERYDIQKMWISGAIHTTNEYIHMMQLIKTNHIPTQVVWNGTSTNIDGVHLEVVHPLQNMAGQRPADQHDATVVVRATYGDKHFLFTGDLNEDHEQAMVDAAVPLQADVLKVPHHGSATGLLPAFLAKVHPSYAIIQVGAHNSFGHPAPSTLKKLLDDHIQTYRNDRDGTIEAITDGHALHVFPL